MRSCHACTDLLHSEVDVAHSLVPDGEIVDMQGPLFVLDLQRVAIRQLLERWSGLCRQEVYLSVI